MSPALAAFFTPTQQRSDFSLFHPGYKFAGARTLSGLLRPAVALCVALAVGTAASAQKPVKTPSTYGDAMRWYQKAAEAGSPQAQFLLGMKYDNGVGADPDPGRAVDWFRRAAEGGHALAQYRLASALNEGRGVERNVAGAASWYRRAAENGIPEAAFNLAYILDKGLAGAADAAGAAKWYLMAAEAGLGQAQFNLAVLHAEGRGVARDPVEAWIWFSCAVAAGLPNAERYLRRVDKKIDEAQRAAARTAVERRCGPGNEG
ncbi:MAG: tetratricopeptide repeat protein [Defluviicoccus sp.]|nr:tetratricopeptide repeat protein [Defluviicoccus sp.]